MTSGRAARGQLVLLAAVALAVALVPLTVAYLQLGYHEDIGTHDEGPEFDQVHRVLDHALHDAVADLSTEYVWSERSEAVVTVRDRMEPTVDAVATSGLADGVAYEVSYNGTRAASWATANCPSGPDRQFGACHAEQGVVVQERDGRTHVLAAAFDVGVAATGTDSTLTTTVEVRSE